MTNLESFAHRTAKGLIAKWARPHYDQVAIEYPLAITFDDMYLDDGRLNLTGNRLLIGADKPWSEFGYPKRPPTPREIKQLGLQTLYVVDVAARANGKITGFFEVTHKHPLDPMKRFILHTVTPNIWEIPAAWVLRQVAPPTTIPRQFRCKPIRWVR